MWARRELRLEARPRGFHLVTDEVTSGVPELAGVRIGMVHVLLAHTSASLTLNENASRAVLEDFRSWFDRAVPDDAAYWTHRSEGPDDMPAHVKSALLDSSLTLPVADGRLVLGDLAGDLPVRAPRLGWAAAAGGDGVGRGGLNEFPSWRRANMRSCAGTS